MQTLRLHDRLRQTGFALIEVLVAVLVLAFGMLGLAAMLMAGHKSNSSSYAKQQAVQSAYDIVDRIRANSQAAINGSYTVSNLSSGGAAVLPSLGTDCNVAVCTPAQLAGFDLYYWQAKDLTQLPNGSGAIAIAASGASNTLVTVTVQWDDQPAQAKLGAASASASGAANLARFVVQTVL